MKKRPVWWCDYQLNTSKNTMIERNMYLQGVCVLVPEKRTEKRGRQMDKTFFIRCKQNMGKVDCCSTQTFESQLATFQKEGQHTADRAGVGFGQMALQKPTRNCIWTFISPNFLAAVGKGQWHQRIWCYTRRHKWFLVSNWKVHHFVL